MSIINTCKTLVGKMTSKNIDTYIEEEIIEDSKEMYELFEEVTDKNDPQKDSGESKLKTIAKDFIINVKQGLLDTEYSYLTERGFASLKYDIIKLREEHQSSATRSAEDISNDMKYTDTNEKGKTIKRSLDKKGERLLDRFFSTSNKIAMYKHMQDGVREYDGIYYSEEFNNLKNDPRLKQEEKKRLEDMYNSHYDDVVDFEIERYNSINEDQQIGKREMSRIKKKAEEQATNYTFVEGFLKGYNQKLENEINTDPRLLEVYNNILKSRKELQKQTSERMRKANRNIDNMFIFKPEEYYRAVFYDMEKNNSRGKKDLFGVIDISKTTRAGSNKSHYHNFFVQELAYRSLLKMEGATAEFVSKIYNNKEFDKTHELKDATIKAISQNLSQFSDRINNKELSKQEQMLMFSFAKKFNRLVGSRYQELSFDIPNTMSDQVEMLGDKDNLFNQIQKGLDTAINNEKNIIITKFKKGEYDSIIKQYPQFEYIRDYYVNNVGNVTERDLLAFENFFSKHEDKLFNVVKLSKFKSLKDGMTNTILSMNGFDFKNDLLIPNIYKNGKRRVIVNDLGTRLKAFSSNETFNLEQIKQEGNLDDDTFETMKKEYKEKYDEELKNLIEKSLTQQNKDTENESFVSEEKRKFNNEASLLALDYVQGKYLEPSFLKSLYYSDSKNIASMTKQEIQKILLEDNSDKDEYRDFMQKLQTSNILIKELLDGNLRFVDADVAKSISDVQHEMLNQTYKEDAKGMKVLKEATRASKFGLLYSPFRFPKFSANNTVGDYTMALLNRPGVALKSVSPKVISEYTKKFWKIGDAEWNADEQYFNENSQSFLKLNYNELLGNLDQQTKREIEKMESELSSIKDNLSFTRGLTEVKKILGKYSETVTKISEFREMYLRNLMYNNVLEEIKNTGTVKHYGTTDRKAVKGILDQANKETDPERKLELQRQSALVFANQAFIMYDDLSKFANNVSSWGMPFIRFAEGNMRLHFRLASNLFSEFREGIKEQNYGKLGRTTVRASASSAVAIGIPMAMWNAINMALFGIDDEDIPEYAKENGYTMLGNTFITNTDITSDFAENLGFKNLKYNIAQQVEDEGLALGLAKGVADSYTNPFETLLSKSMNYLSPLLKAPIEMWTGMDYYPDSVVPVGSKYTMSENAVRKSFQVLGLERFYEIGKTASDPYAKLNKNMVEMFGFKTTGDSMNEYFLARSNAMDYAENVLGKPQRSTLGYQPKDFKSNLRYSIYQAIKNQDDEFAFKLFNEYIGYVQEESQTQEELDKEIQSLKQSLKNYFDVIPTSSIPKKEYENYILSLNDKEYRRLENAYLNQEELLGPYYEFIYG